MRKAQLVRITGMVQGVGFRWTAKRIADSIGIDGWVRNNPDGSVTLQVEGAESANGEFMERLHDAMGSYMETVEAREIQAGSGRGGFVITTG